MESTGTQLKHIWNSGSPLAQPNFYSLRAASFNFLGTGEVRPDLPTTARAEMCLAATVVLLHFPRLIPILYE